MKTVTACFAAAKYLLLRWSIIRAFRQNEVAQKLHDRKIMAAV
jgi:hypothetical protein